MDSDSDFGGDDFDDTAFLEAATQAATQAEKQNTTTAFQASPRPTKRRKVNGNRRPRPFESSDEDGDFCLGDEFSTVPARGKGTSNDLESKSPRKEGVAEKRRNRIHQPFVVQDLTDISLTQPSREPSPPWKQRGAIWQKPATTIGVHKPVGSDAMKTMMLPSRQSIVSRPVSRASGESKPASPRRAVESPKLPSMNKHAINYDATEELADLPSDAFASSSSSPLKNDDVVLVSERRTRVVAPQTGLRQTTLFGRQIVNGEIPQSQVNKRYQFIVDQKEEPPTHHKLDPEAIKTWVYPTNLGTIRDYQYNIVARGLFHNLLVALPTGLGKTFIAATIMLNWYRWTTDAKIVFLAPTKPLVSQQIDACFHICGIPRSDTTMLIGGVSAALRAEEWSSKRVFFMTPQTLDIDLKSGYADPKKIVLLVIDEAHKATGAYAYAQNVNFLRRFNDSFRVLALTATPGSTIESVQEVINNLEISRVEIRTENSWDIRGYIHHRKVEKQVFSYSDEMNMCMDLYRQALQSTFNKVAFMFYSRDPVDLTPYGVTMASKRYMQEAGRHANPAQKGMVRNTLILLGSISQGMELLKYHGIGPFYVKMKEFKDSMAKTSKTNETICNSEAFKKLMVRLQTWTSNENFVGHPKLDFLQQAILDHFVNVGDGSGSDTAAVQTRIMVFAHFRDSAEEIVRVLRKHQPMIRPRVFVGQSNSKNSDGMNQKEQREVIEKFKAGTFNTLVATSIGEEGLDIGEVDLIICYDSKASPIRMLQRMGRTGRKREGKVIMLQMEGKEVDDANKAKDNYEAMQEVIAEGSKFNFHDDLARRILPKDVRPVAEQRVVEIPLENSQSDWLPEPKKKRGKPPKKPPKKFHMPDDVITGFVTAGRMDQEIAPRGRGKKVVQVCPSEEVVELPALESVLLDETATDDLEHRYQTVSENDNAATALNWRPPPDSQRKLSKTHYFPQHGRATEGFVKTLQRMHTMDDDRLDEFNDTLHMEDCRTEPPNIVIPDADITLLVTEDMWADDDPASQPLPTSNTKRRPKPKPKPIPELAVPKDMWADDDPGSQPPQNPKVKAKPGPKPKPKAEPKAKAKTTPKQSATRGRPRKDPSVTTAPARAPETKEETLTTKKDTWRMPGLADEGHSSSPLPSDPDMRVASQAETIGSDDTIGAFESQDTQAYLQDSELASFIADDNENVELEVLPTSSFPGTDLNGIGKGTQAVLKAARPKRPRKADKIFTSDISDDDAVVSSDSDDDVPLRRAIGTELKAPAFVVDSESEAEEDEPLVPKKRARRVIEDDEDDD